jgi:hypothetical protein
LDGIRDFAERAPQMFLEHVEFGSEEVDARIRVPMTLAQRFVCEMSSSLDALDSSDQTDNGDL